AVAEYTRLGRLKSIQFRPLPRDTSALEGNEPIRKSAHLGQHYAHCSSVGESGRRAWRFVEFLVPDEIRDERNQALIERFLVSIFRAVPLSVMNKWTEADLVRQFNRVCASGWLANFETHATAGGFPVE